MDDGLIDGVAAMTKFVNLCIAGAVCCGAAGGRGAFLSCVTAGRIQSPLGLQSPALLLLLPCP